MGPFDVSGDPVISVIRVLVVVMFVLALFPLVLQRLAVFLERRALPHVTVHATRQSSANNVR